MENLVGLAAVITAMVGLLKFFDEKSAKKNGQMLAKMDEKLDAMDKRIEQGQREDKLAITRLEMMSLMAHDPENVVEIERLARKYFNPPMNGDTYMSSVYSAYAKKYNADYTFVSHRGEAC